MFLDKQIRGLAAIAVGLMVLTGCGSSGGKQPAASPSSAALHRCEGPAEQALARYDGTIVGRIGPNGATIVGKVWLEPLIENTPVTGEGGRVDALLAVPQPPVELLACHGGRYRILYPACDEWWAGEINAFEPTTGKPTVRLVTTAASPGGCWGLSGPSGRRRTAARISWIEPPRANHTLTQGER
jgi:hypothetical protein